MSQFEEQEYIDGVAFRWGKKGGAGRKGSQFYESFTYDGIEYTLYDCVYLYKEGELLPYIGKLVRIWETPDNLKKVKIHWFFHPLEISNWLGDVKILETEVFLASGEGVGLANVNPLEAIAGKCDVVCISKDSRNPLPSEEERKKADYIFYRTFDVGQCTISDRMDDYVGGLEVKHVFNKRRDSTISTLSLDSGKDAGKTSVESLAIITNKDAPIGSGDRNASGATSNVADMAVKSGKRPNISGDEAIRNEARTLVPTTSGKKMNTVKRKDFAQTEKDVECTKDVNSEDRPSKKVRSVGYQEVDMAGSANLMSKGKMTPTGNSFQSRKDHRDETDQKLTKSIQVKPLKEPGRNFPAEGRREGEVSSVSQRPPDERSIYFMEIPWEKRIEIEHEKGTIVQLMNLDPAYSSGEVEDIIWHAFKEHCSAKMLQHTMISSPHSAQAFIIMKTKGTAERIVKELTERCLMLSNGRPLVASFPPPLNSSEKQSTFVGHLTLDIRVRQQHQRQREAKAVSTSHCAQPNTSEYDMAMEWVLLQARSDYCWEQVYKRQGKELNNLMAKLKPFEQQK